jgi:peptide/nickel transport system substrate-binding protein
LVILGLVAAACGGNGGTPSDRNRSAEPTNKTGTTEDFTVTTDPNVKGPAPEVPGAQKGGTITVLTRQVPHTLDPTRAYYTDSLMIARLVFRTPTALVMQDDGSYKLIPDLMTDLGKPNEDFTEWTFTVKDGIKFEDGTPVTSKDFAYAVKRSFAVEELPNGPVYQQSYFLDGDKYKGPFQPAAKGGGPDYKGVATPDDKTLVLKMAKPFPDLPYYMNFPIFTPIPEKKDTRQNYENAPIATGPYKYKEFKKGDQLVLEKNDQWDPATDPFRHQYADAYHFKFDQDRLRLQEQLIANKGPDQTAITYDGVDSSLLPRIVGKEPEKRLVKGAGTCSFFTYLDVRKIPLEVRRAILVAWPYDAERQAAGESPLTSEPATTIMPPTTPGWENFDVAGLGSKGNGDPARAKQMLEAAGKLNFELIWNFSSDDQVAGQVSTVRKNAMEKAGFKVTAIPLPQAQGRVEANNPKSRVNVRPGGGWCLDWPSGGTIFPAILYGPLIAANPEGVPNGSFLDEDKVDEAIDKALVLPTEEQKEAWAAIDKLIMEEFAPVVPDYYARNTFLHGSKVGGVRLDVYANGPEFTRLFVTP